MCFESFVFLLSQSSFSICRVDEVSVVDDFFVWPLDVAVLNMISP